MNKRTKPKIDPHEKFLTVTEAAPLLHLHRQTVQEHCAAGKIRCTKPGFKYLIPESAIGEFLTGKAVAMVA